MNNFNDVSQTFDKVQKTFKTELSTKGFEEVSFETAKELKLDKKVGLVWRSLSFSKKLNLLITSIDLITLKLIYRGDRIVISSTSIFYEKLIEKTEILKLICSFMEQFKINESKYFENFNEEVTNESFRDWADYEIPDKLPQIKQKIESTVIPIVIYSIITAMFVGFLWAVISISFQYVPLLYEMIVSILIIYAFGKGIKKGNYLNETSIKFILIGIVLFTLFFNELCQYFYYINTSVISEISIVDFLTMKLNSGLIVEDTNYGKLGVMFLWIFRFLSIYWMSNIFIKNSIENNRFQHIPFEVHDWISYLIMNGKTDKEIRESLSIKGWEKKLDQDEALKAME